MIALTVDIFVGLVTHPRTRFPHATSDSGLGPAVAHALSAKGVSVRLEIHDEDSLTATDIDTSPAAIRAAIAREFSIERRWREYVSGRKASLGLRSILSARKMKRILQLAPPWSRSLKPNDAGPRALLRLANIEAAHLSLMRQAVTVKARWALILEDDASSLDPTEFAEELWNFIQRVETEEASLAMINLSESFSIDQLGISHLLVPIADQDFPWTVSSAARHVTNTVCAVLYEREFLTELTALLDDIPLEPVIPIDFKVNEALLRGKGHLSGETWVCSPAPLTQDSGVPSASTRFIG